MYKILFEQGDRHDATIYYVNITSGHFKLNIVL